MNLRDIRNRLRSIEDSEDGRDWVGNIGSADLSELFARGLVQCETVEGYHPTEFFSVTDKGRSLVSLEGMNLLPITPSGGEFVNGILFEVNEWNAPSLSEGTRAESYRPVSR